jgi:PiT family inorganic phosphate transporter
MAWGVNWDKAKEIGLSLIISPLIGFGLAAALMWFIIHVFKIKVLIAYPERRK